MFSLNNLYLKKQRRAIAMIELIFAIVIMGITLMSAPMLIGRASQSSYVALQQESIAAGATQLAIVMTKAWDHSDTNETTEYIPVLHTQSGGTAGAVLPNCTTNYPVGVTITRGRYCKIPPKGFYNATAIGKEGGSTDFDDIDDYNGTSSTLSVYNSESSISDYIDKNITITTNVYYGDDIPRTATGSTSAGGYDKNINFSNPFRTSSSTTTHIKFVTITLTSNNTATELNNKKIFLSAFMCNIGAPDELESNKGSL